MQLDTNLSGIIKKDELIDGILLDFKKNKIADKSKKYSDKEILEFHISSDIFIDSSKINNDLQYMQKKPFFNKKQNPFRDKFFYIRDMLRDISRLGKKREERLNVIYLDEMGAMHYTTGYAMYENIEFFIGGLKISKGIKKAIKTKIYFDSKFYHCFFFPHFYYENFSLKIAISENLKVSIDELERDRELIIDLDLVKTQLEMDENQAGILRTSVIAAGSGGIFIGACLMTFILFILSHL